MTPAEWDAQIKSIIAHAGRGTVDLLAADLLLSGAGEGAAVLKSRTEKLIRSIPPERLNEFSQSVGKARVIWDKAAEAFALERSPLPALAGEAGSLDGLSLAEQEAAELVLQAESTKKASGVSSQSNGTLSTARDAVLRVNNMKEFFETPFGKSLEGKVVKLKRSPYHGQSLYQVEETINIYLKRGDIFYLDGLHKDHIEVFTKNGVIRSVLSLDGLYNERKFLIAYEQGRRLNL